jgi:hypothetical protein
MSDKITTSITNALAAANLINQLVTGVIDQSNSKLASENIFERKTQVVRSTSHLKRVMSQTWFTEALNMDQFTTINNAIVAGEDYTVKIMVKKVMYNSSMPRAGSTLIQNILGQNPESLCNPYFRVI